MSTEYEKTALLALPAIAEGSSEQKGLLSWSRPYMIDQIRQHGVDVAITRGVKSFDEAGNVAHDVIRPRYSEEGTEVTRIDRLGSIGLDSFGMIRNIVRPLTAETTTPQLNPNSIRYLARNKFAVMQDLLVPAGVYNRQAVTIDGETSPSDISASIDSLPGDFIVAKPNGGQRSRGVIVGTKVEVENALRDSGVTEPYILEEKLHFANALPGIHGRSADEHAELERANQAGVNREVRTYFFGQNDWDTVGRVAKVGETDFRSDEWLQLDLESVLGTLVESANDVVARIRERIGTNEVNIAFDWVYASSASNPEPTWQVMEMNATEPQLVQLHEDAEVGRRHHDKMAKQISRVALS